MNIRDVEFEKPEGDMLELIFEKQKQLMEKYHHIEESQGVGYGILDGRKFDLNEIRSQCLVKDFAWRVVEELTEATECNPHDETEHLLEELADALHFLTELCIMVDITPDDLVRSSSSDKLETLLLIFDPSEPYDVVQQLGLAMNCLKQKPWKMTHVLTDTAKFRDYIIQAYFNLIGLFGYFGVTALEIYALYFKKNKVNQFRQNSNY